MHTPEKWKMNAKQEIIQFIEQFGFAVVVSNDFHASHLPLLFKPDLEEHGMLYGHFARTNQHWKTVNNTEVLVVFSGPHSYISPSWYHSSPAVPTWNYAAIHIRGVIELTDDETTFAMLDETVKKYEPSLTIDPDYKNKLAKGIVGFQIKVTSIEAKDKLGQHRSVDDQKGVTNALACSEALDNQMLYRYMIAKQIGTGI